MLGGKRNKGKTRQVKIKITRNVHYFHYLFIFMVQVADLMEFLVSTGFDEYSNPKADSDEQNGEASTNGFFQESCLKLGVRILSIKLNFLLYINQKY